MKLPSTFSEVNEAFRGRSMRNRVFDAAWVELREQILTHLQASYAAGHSGLNLTLHLEQVDRHTGRALARLSDGAEFTVTWDAMAAALEDAPCFGSPARPN